MAHTPEAANLTEAHRQAQLQIRAQALRAYLLLWPLWREGDDGSFDQLAAASVALVWAHHRLSSTLASIYYKRFRTSEGVAGEPTVRLAPRLPREEIAGTLHLVGRDMARKATLAGKPPEDVRQAALIRTSGTISRLSLNGGRDTLLESAQADPQALGWGRVTDGDPCVFCRLLASRGPVYKADTAGFEAHDHCGCAAEVHYPGADWPGLGKTFRAEYNQAVSEAKAVGEFKHGTNNDSLNAYRRFLEKSTASSV